MIKRVIVTSDRREELTEIIRQLPSMIAGRTPDRDGIAAGFRARIAWTFFSLVAPNFNELGRGQPGVDGDKWPPLTKEYLAYQRPVKGRQPPKAGGLAPGGNDGFLTPAQLKQWKQIFADRYAFYVMRESDEKAKEIAARLAWHEIKKQGAKTKLQEFGGRKVGVEYQTLVDTGRLRQSLQPGELIDRGIAAEYQPSEDQVSEDLSYQIVVGTNVQHAGAHHNAKSPKRRRRFWPERFPNFWWDQIFGVARSGILRIGELVGGVDQ